MSTQEMNKAVKFICINLNISQTLIFRGFGVLGVTIMDHVRPSKGDDHESQAPLLLSSTLMLSNPRPQGFYLGAKSKP